MERIDNWLEAKYTGNGLGPDRHDKEPNVFHASSIGKCPRQNYYKRKNNTSDEWSPYFELGLRFEDIYGAALAWAYLDVPDHQIKRLDNTEIIRLCPRVVQDITCDIDVGGKTITGEADWAVLEEDAGHITHVHRSQDDSARVDYKGGGFEEFDDIRDVPVELVIETKTTKKISWRKKYGCKEEHKYQVGSYMRAFGCDGEVVYMTRNELDEMTFEFAYDDFVEDNFFRDMELRTEMLAYHLDEGTVPEANPPRDNICKYCDFKSDCKAAGGKRWD